MILDGERTIKVFSDVLTCVYSMHSRFSGLKENEVILALKGLDGRVDVDGVITLVYK